MDHPAPRFNLFFFLHTLHTYVYYAEGWLVHVDLHETTDTDETEFRPAKAARDGEYIDPDTIPDGFYCVGDTANPQDDFQKARGRIGGGGEGGSGGIVGYVLFIFRFSRVTFAWICLLFAWHTCGGFLQ